MNREGAKYDLKGKISTTLETLLALGSNGPLWSSLSSNIVGLLQRMGLQNLSPHPGESSFDDWWSRINEGVVTQVWYSILL
jgi:hypothetical protein